MIRRMPKIKTDDHTETAIPDIIEAAYRGDCERVQKLLQAGADVNSVDPRDNLSCLHIAGLQGDHALAEIIIEWNALHNDVDFSIKSRFKPRLAWQFAINANHPQIANVIHRASFASNPAPL